MNEDMRQRRAEVWKKLVVNGLDYSTVTMQVANKFDVTRRTIEKDISSMSEWLPKLDEHSLHDGISQLREIRDVRSRMHRLASEARKGEGDLEKSDELDILKAIIKSTGKDVEIAQSLGQMVETADRHEHTHDHQLGEAYLEMLDEAEERRDESGMYVESSPADVGEHTPDGPEPLEITAETDEDMPTVEPTAEPPDDAADDTADEDNEN
jgi:hypothetical protein